jgi:DNA-directed RNA polymerase specialized sigma24 family protein
MGEEEGSSGSYGVLGSGILLCRSGRGGGAAADGAADAAADGAADAEGAAVADAVANAEAFTLDREQLAQASATSTVIFELRMAGRVLSPGPGMSKAPTHPHAARLSKPEVIAKIRSVIPRRIQSHDRDDIVQGAMIRLLMLPELPETDDGLLGMAVVMTKRELIDSLRRQARAARREVDADELAEVLEIPEPATGLAKQVVAGFLEYVEKQVAAGDVEPDIAEAARMLAAGHSYAEIAEAKGTKATTLKSRMRKIFTQYAAVAGAALVVLVVLLWPPRPSPTEDRTNIGYEPPPPPVFSAPTEGNPEDVDMPPKLWREFAHEACNMVDYARCERYLDRAKKLDPDGELDPGVQRMRDEIHKNRFGHFVEPEAGIPPPPY